MRDSSPRNVMVVDDELEIREALADLLETLGFGTLTAANGREALERLQSAVVAPRLILLDLMMPVMDGETFRTAQLASPEFRNIPVVVVSAFQDVEKAAGRLQASDFLKKPFTFDQIRHVLERFCAA